MSASSWIGVDLDGTLAVYKVWDGSIGEPIPAMVNRVKKWLLDGVEVKIFTARVGFGGRYSEESKRSDDEKFAMEQKELIETWCEKHIGAKLPITATKDFRMIELWDDRSVQVEMNTGRRIDGKEDK